MSSKTSQIQPGFRLQQYRSSIYSIATFILISLLACGLVLTSDYREFEKRFSADVEKIHVQFDFYIKQNEFVLEGFSAFIAGLGNVNDVMLNRYAKQVKQRFPHIYMLEIAKEVKRLNLKSLIQEQRRKGNKSFEVREFDYSGNREWKKLPDRDKYLPLIYLYPLDEESKEILGLDLHSHESLGIQFQKAINSKDYQTSLPFTLIEGDKAFVMFKSVQSADDNKPVFMTLLVLTVKDFFLNENEMDSSLGVIVYHNSKPANDKSGHIFLKEIEHNSLLPQLRFTASLFPGQSGFVLQINKQFEFKDTSWVALFIILSVLTSIFFISRGVSTKNKLVEGKLLKASQQKDKMVAISNLTGGIAHEFNKLVEEKLLKASQQKHKMVAISNLTGGIAHEFNNNLSVIRGFLNLLSDEAGDNRESKIWISHAEKATEKSIELTRKLLTYSRYKGIRERVSQIEINKHILKMKNELSVLLKEDVNLKYNLTDESHSVLFGEEDFKEILFELVVNANDAIEGKGLIVISTKKVHLNSLEEFGIEHGVDVTVGDYILMAVSDTGQGISDDNKSHVYEPFFTTKTFGDRPGMGLASVYGLVKLNNGYIIFSSNNEKGTVFNIYLPISEI